MRILILWLSSEVRFLHLCLTDITHCNQSSPCYFKVVSITPNSLLITKHIRNHFIIHLFFALKNYIHSRLTAFPPKYNNSPEKSVYRWEIIGKGYRKERRTAQGEGQLAILLQVIIIDLYVLGKYTSPSNRIWFISFLVRQNSLFTHCPLK